MKFRTIEQTFISASASFKESQVVLFGCPYDGTASFRPGARFGPSAIRRASWGIETYSPYLQKDLTRLQIHDAGDLELPLGDKNLALELIRKAAGQVLASRKFPVALGGDHLITLPILEEVNRAYRDLCLVQLDAHTDLREDYLGETDSHSTVMKRILDRSSGIRLFQIGIRSGTEEEFREGKRIRSLVPCEPHFLRAMAKRIGNRPVYLTLDLDLLDPSLLPGVGTPEPGGLTFQGFLSLLKELQRLRVVGFDIVELTPDYDPAQISAVTASVVLREMILTFCWSRSKKWHRERVTRR